MQNEMEKTICTGLFLYSNHVVLIEVVAESENADYVLEENLVSIFNVVDERMSE
jgi:hypothetical protein